MYVLLLSYGKDSLACLGAIEELGWPLDRIVHAEVMATETIPADLPPMVEFKKKADVIIKERFGIEVEHIRHKKSYQEMFYGRFVKGKEIGRLRGWPLITGEKSWCKHLKINEKINIKGNIVYIGIAVDEPDRFHNLTKTKLSPLKEAKWTEANCRKWCEENDLLSPIYTDSARSGCWFCHNQGVDQLRLLRKNYPEYWTLMLKWDSDSPVTFHADGHTVHDFEKRFQLEDEHFLVPGDKRFRWKMIEEDLQKTMF